MTPDRIRALIAIPGSLVYIGIAVVARGGITAFFAVPQLALLVPLFLIAAVAAVYSPGDLSPGVEEDRSNRWVISALSAIGVLAAVVAPLSDYANVLTVGDGGVRWLGLVLGAGGSALRLWPVFVLGNRFSGLVAIQPGHMLETHGIYSVIRHPSYLGLLLSSLGWGLVFRSLLGVALAVALIVPVMARIRAEEALLERWFGADYVAYRTRVARFIPGIY
jgi:protein-S-isoprenylcysteine O-methyltransferase Ste14